MRVLKLSALVLLALAVVVVGADYEDGLARLKDVVEAQPAGE